MTVVAIKDGIVATDSAAHTARGLYVGTVRKIARSPEGHVIACSGTALSVAAMLHWVESGLVGSPGTDPEEYHALLVRPDGSVCEVGGDGLLVQVDAPFHASGSGRELAIAAMACGKSAEEAVQIACRWHGACGEPVQTLRLGGE
jgi:ABC-type uncharacterized transport system permease subunit